MEIKLHWQMTEAEVAALYEAGQAEGALGLVAYDARQLTLALFEAFARRAEVLGAVYEEDRPQGFFYLTDFAGATARIHFALYAAGRPDRLNLGRQVLAWCFQTFELQSLLGVIPALNSGAAGYALALGGRELGRIPGYCWVARLKRTVAGRQFLFEREAA